MTPKEKARELYNEMAIEWIQGTSSYPDLSPDFLIPKNQYVKQCAKIAVDEIFYELNSIEYTSEVAIKINYWQEVKQEIEKL
jgi:hypothetical protein